MAERLGRQGVLGNPCGLQDAEDEGKIRRVVGGGPQVWARAAVLWEGRASVWLPLVPAKVPSADFSVLPVSLVWR